MTELYTGISDGPGAKGYKISEVGGSSSLGRFCFSAEFAMIHENRVGPIYDHRLYYKTCHDTTLDLNYLLLTDEKTVKIKGFQDFRSFRTSSVDDKFRVSIPVNILENAGLEIGGLVALVGNGNYVVAGKREDLENLVKINVNQE